MTSYLPTVRQYPGPRDDSFEQTDVVLIEVTTHDRNDIVIGRQRIALFIDTKTDNYMASSTTETL